MEKIDLKVFLLCLFTNFITFGACVEPKKYKSYDERYALAAACSVGTISEIEDLLSKGHNPNKQCKFLFSPLGCSLDRSKKPKNHRAIITMLLRAGAHPDLEETLGYTPLIKAVGYYTDNHEDQYLLMAIQVLLCAGADWQKCNSFNESAFSLAQSKPACRMLIEDYKSSAQEKWLKEAKRILKQKYVGEEQILEDILFLAKPVTAEEIIQVTPPHFD